MAEAMVVVAPEWESKEQRPESFQRSLLEAQFANSAPNSASYMVDDDNTTTTIAEATGTAIVNVVIGGG